jgi:hypothetical protein
VSAFSHLSTPIGRGIAPNGVSASVNLRARASKSTARNNNTSMAMADTPMEQSLQELTENFKLLQKETDETKERLTKTEDELTSFKKEAEERLTKSEQRFQGILVAFDPATKYALLETAIYTFVEFGLRNYRSVDKIKYPASTLANHVLTLLLSGDVSESKFGWLGPKNSQIGNDGYNGGLFVVGLQVLGALVAFIENEHTSKEDLEDWPPERNVVAHNGEFLKALYGGEGAPVVAKTPELIEVMRADFGEKSKETIRPQPERWEAQLGEELDKVEKALTEKGLAPNALGKKAALEVLKRICSPLKK